MERTFISAEDFSHDVNAQFFFDLERNHGMSDYEAKIVLRGIKAALKRGWRITIPAKDLVN